MNAITTWGEHLDPLKVLQEYPRPQLIRDSYQNLNGWWQYTITYSEETPSQFDSRILVPFSPEAPLSGVNRALEANEFAWYRLHVELNDQIRLQLSAGNALRVHFGAVDQEAWVYVNGVEIGRAHV